MGDAIPTELQKLMLSAGRDESVEVESIYDAARWNIDLEGYALPEISRASFLNACVNEATLRSKRPIGDPVFATMDWNAPDAALIDRNGEEVLDNNDERIAAKDWVLPPEDSEFVEMSRSDNNAPDLLRFVKLRDNALAAQFSFNRAGSDEDFAFWCTAVKPAGQDVIRIFPNNISYMFPEKVDLTKELAPDF